MERLPYGYIDELVLLLTEPGTGGAGQPLPEGTHQEPGGWNRIQLHVVDFETTVDQLAADGANSRNEIVSGTGGKQILLEDPTGKATELFEPERR